MNSCMKQVLLVLFVSLVLRQDVASNTSNTAKTSTTLSTIPSTNDVASNTSNTTKTSTTPSTNDVASNTSNTTSTTPSTNGYVNSHGDLPKGDNNGMLERSLYVAIGISALVAIYFIVRWIKTRGRRKAKKYGVIHGTGEAELQPLEKHIDEDEEDMTLFDAKDSKRPKQSYRN